MTKAKVLLILFAIWSLSIVFILNGCDTDLYPFYRVYHYCPILVPAPGSEDTTDTTDVTTTDVNTTTEGTTDETTGSTTDESTTEGTTTDETTEDEDPGHPSNGKECKEGEIVVCHYPRGNPTNFFTICVGSEQAANAHLGHGDTLGYCGVTY